MHGGKLSVQALLNKCFAKAREHCVSESWPRKIAK
jgi:hypothetical protein